MQLTLPHGNIIATSYPIDTIKRLRLSLKQKFGHSY